MFGVDTSELILLAVLALIFIGPKDLPMALRTVGRWVGQVRGMARHFHTGVEAMIREAELEEMEKKWREENERIMRDYPALLEADQANYDQEVIEQPTLPLESGEELPPEKRELP
jgi:sec-independent protein translocase protein TatB